MSFATGIGWDSHRLVEGRPLILGGVRIEHDRGLAGHSDADVLCHAVIDALLGAAGLGDIGEHFPDDDPRWKDADSLALLSSVHSLLAAEGWVVTNIDASVLLERPKLRPHRVAMRKALAGARDDFEYILLDCPPSLGPLTVNALVAADRVIVPVQTEYFALEGLAGLLDTLALIQRELNPRLTVAGMILTMHDARTKLAQDVEAEVRKHFPALVFDTVIPRNVRLGEAPSFGRPVIHHDPHCAGSDAYFELAKEVAARG